MPSEAPNFGTFTGKFFVDLTTVTATFVTSLFSAVVAFVAGFALVLVTFVAALTLALASFVPGLISVVMTFFHCLASMLVEMITFLAKNCELATLVCRFLNIPMKEEYNYTLCWLAFGVLSIFAVENTQFIHRIIPFANGNT